MSVLLSGFGDKASQAIHLFCGDTRNLTAEQRGDHFFRGTVKKSFDEMAESGTSGDVARNGREIDEPEAMLFVADMAFFFEDAKLRAYGGIVGVVGKRGEDLGDGGALQFVEQIHDLAFAAGERLGFGGGHGGVLVV
jgi:hypothetical protein